MLMLMLMLMLIAATILILQTGKRIELYGVLPRRVTV
jgi:hypothetical protein